MKKILLINGSPRGLQSNTRRIACQFLEGLAEQMPCVIEEFVCAQKNLHPCTGCLSCWKRDDGRCIQQDDMSTLLEQYRQADLVVWSFPNYFYGMPSTAKMVLERLLPLELPQLMQVAPERTRHPKRYDLSHQQYLVFVSCGYYNTEDNLEALRMQFRWYYGERCQLIACPEGGLFSSDFLRMVTLPYLRKVKQAGRDYAKDSKLNLSALQEPMLSLEDYLAFTNRNALSRHEGESAEQFRLRKLHALMAQMAQTYSGTSTGGKTLVLEVELSDADFHCQFHMQDKSCQLMEEADFLPYHLKIIASENFFRPQQALSEALSSQTQTQADFDLLVALTARSAKSGKPKTMHLDFKGKKYEHH